MRFLEELAIGGTALGTGVNTHPEFGRRVAENIAAATRAGAIVAPPVPAFYAARTAEEGMNSPSARRTRSE